MIGRDEDGRITGLTRAGAVTRYGYDGAGQLVAAATTPFGKSEAAASAGAQVSEWEYDAGGRLVHEYTPAGPRTYAYHAAGEGSIAARVLGGPMTSRDKKFNKVWMNAQVSSGKNIVDIGVGIDG